MEKNKFLTEAQIEDINNNSHDCKWWLVYGLDSNQLKGVSLDSYKNVAKKLTDATLNIYLNTSKNKETDVYKIFHSELESRK